MNTKAEKLQPCHSLEDLECSLKCKYFNCKKKENHWDIWGRGICATELNLRKGNLKGKVVWVGEWQLVRLTETYSKLKEILVYRRGERG